MRDAALQEPISTVSIQKLTFPFVYYSTAFTDDRYDGRGER
jgi:hypothetical protein